MGDQVQRQKYELGDVYSRGDGAVRTSIRNQIDHCNNEEAPIAARGIKAVWSAILPVPTMRARRIFHW